MGIAPLTVPAMQTTSVNHGKLHQFVLWIAVRVHNSMVERDMGVKVEMMVLINNLMEVTQLMVKKVMKKMEMILDSVWIPLQIARIMVIAAAMHVMIINVLDEQNTVFHTCRFVVFLNFCLQYKKIRFL